MVLDKIPGPTIFTQRDVRETPAATATATSVGLTDPTYVTLSNDADLNNERVLTAGEGMNLSDGGAGSTITVSGENASDTNKGIAKFQLSDFSVSSGDVSLKAVVVMSVDGDTGTATPALNNLDILGGTGISTAGGANDITITSTHASDNGSSHADVATNTTHRGLTNDPHSVTKSQVGLGNVTNVATSDTAYNATSWDNNTDAATKNAIRDKIESLAGGHDEVTLNVSATNGGMSILAQEISNRAATNAQTGYMTNALVTNIESNVTHSTGDGSDHADVASNTSASHAESHNMASHTDDYSAGEGIDISAGNVISAETATATNQGISELATEDEVQTGTDTGRTVTPDTLQSVLPPIGAVQAWLKSFTNTPQTLPTGWVECGGQTLSDADSVYNGQVIPDLNGDNRFLRGNATSGGTGGSETMAHTHTMAIKLGSSFLHNSSQDGTSGTFTQTHRLPGAQTEQGGDFERSKTSAASNTENRPPFYNVVWIMRIK